MNAYYLLQELKANLDDDGVHWGDAELIRKLSFAHNKVFHAMGRSPGDRFVTSTNLTPSASVLTLPTNFGKFVYMEETSSGIPIKMVGSIRERRMSRGTGTTLSTGSLTCYFVGDTIEINQDSYGTQVTLWYDKKPVMLHTGTGDTGSTTNTIIFEDGHKPSHLDDYYNGQYVEVVDGTGAGTKAEITDYVGSTREATVAGTFSTDSVYGTVPLTPEELDEWVVLEATVLALAKPAANIDTKYFEYFLSRLRDTKRDAKHWMSSRHRGTNLVRMEGDL